MVLSECPPVVFIIQSWRIDTPATPHSILKSLELLFIKIVQCSVREYLQNPVIQSRLRNVVSI